MTFGKTVKSTLDGPVDIMRFLEEVHEEADSRMVVHLAHMLENQINKIIVRTGDTDVIIIILSFMSQFFLRNESTEILIDFGTGSSRRILDMNLIYEHVGESISLALPFFHSFTGCDSTASFYGKSKKFWYELWMKQINEPEDITSAFTQLSWLPSTETFEQNFRALENFVVAAYNFKDRKPEVTLEETRYNFFTMTAKMDLRLLPPSKNALKMHVLRSSYQAGWIWGNAISQRTPPEATSWGWTISQSDNRLQVLWQPPEINSSDVVALLLTSCKCSGKGSKCTTCSCGKLKLPCINPCGCNRKCTNSPRPAQ